MTKEEGEQARKEADAAEAQGRTIGAFRENEIVAVNDRAQIYRLTERVTGSPFADMQRYLRTLDRSKLQGVMATREMMQDRAEQRDVEQQAFREMLRDTNSAARLERATQSKERPLMPQVGRAAKAGTRAIVTAADGVPAGKIFKGLFDTISNTLGGILSFLVPDPPKTRAEIKAMEAESERAAVHERKDAYNRDHERVMEIHAEQRQQDEQQRSRDRDR